MPRPEWAPEVLELFIELAAMPSPPGEERAVADRVVAYLRELGLEVDEDDAGAQDRRDDREPLLPARADRRAGDAALPLRAPRHGAARGGDRAGRRRGRVRPQRAAGRSSAPTTRPRSRSMLEATRADRRGGPAARRASSCSSRRRRRSGCSARTHSTQRGWTREGRLRLRPGGADRRRDPRRAVPAARSTSRFHGRAAHAGMYPEEGRSAIAAAARAIADLRLGRVDEESTANVGVITGGTARNIVPEWCTFAGRGALARRAEARRPHAGDARDVHVRREPRRVRGRDAGRASATAATGSRATTRGRGSRRPRSALRPRADATASRAAAPTRTSSTSAACSASISRTG